MRKRCAHARELLLRFLKNLNDNLAKITMWANLFLTIVLIFHWLTH
jgi:hypothetical protein